MWSGTEKLYLKQEPDKADKTYSSILTVLYAVYCKISLHFAIVH